MFIYMGYTPRTKYEFTAGMTPGRDNWILFTEHHSWIFQSKWNRYFVEWNIPQRENVFDVYEKADGLSVMIFCVEWSFSEPMCLLKNLYSINWYVIWLWFIEWEGPQNPLPRGPFSVSVLGHTDKGLSQWDEVLQV